LEESEWHAASAVATRVRRDRRIIRTDRSIGIAE
jgi:hypothetical protein